MSASSKNYDKLPSVNQGRCTHTGKIHGFRWLRDPNVTRPLLAKGLWNGTGVSAFLLSGEVLPQRYQLDTAHVGMSVTAFGMGLGIGNLSAGKLRCLTGSEERSLIVVTNLLTNEMTPEGWTA